MKIKFKIKSELFVCVSVWFGQAIVSIRNEKQGGFFDTEENEKKKPLTGPPLVQ